MKYTLSLSLMYAISLIVISLSLISFTSDPTKPLTMVVRWKNPSDTLFLKNLRTDERVCCDFSFVTEKVDSAKFCCSAIYSRAGTHLGNVYGNVSVSFLERILPRIEETRYDLEVKRKGTFFPERAEIISE